MSNSIRERIIERRRRRCELTILEKHLLSEKIKQIWRLRKKGHCSNCSILFSADHGGAGDGINCDDCLNYKGIL